MLPDGTLAELIQWTHSNLSWELPVLVVTARENEETVVRSLPLPVVSQQVSSVSAQVQQVGFTHVDDSFGGPLRSR
jgi:hypothetical protein